MHIRRTGHVSFTSFAAATSLVACASLSLACASEAILSTDHLPVRRVIVYRNGVAYFERGGRVDGGEVRFKMKQTEVGDFLATLAVMEKGGSSVRAAAFPLDTGTPEAGDPPPPDDPGKGPAVKPAPLTPQEAADAADRKKGLRTVVLALDGKEHDLQVGYVAASPVWRPSYRLVVHPDGTADLQAWGIVQNLSGEDWKSVHLTLVAGSPLAFETDLGTSLIPTRPTVSDMGEVVMSVPHGETSLKQEMAVTTPAAAPQGASAAFGGDALMDEETTKNSPERSRGRDEKAKVAGHLARAVGGPAKKGAPGAGGGAAPAAPAAEMAATPAFVAAPPPPAPVVPSGPRDLRSLAAIAAEGGSTRYELPTEVTIPDRNATMVMLLSRPVPGEALFLYAPDGGVGESTSHPFRVARFANKSGGVLERGPIAVFEDGSFLGQGLVDPLPDGATATVPFALERSIAVDVDRKWDELGERVAKIENGDLTVERDQVRQTKYRVRNGGEKVAKVLIKHIRMNGARLFSPPKDTEDNVGTGSALVPTMVQPNTTTEFVVDERTPSPRRVDWFGALAGTAIKAFLADPKTDASVAAKLGMAWKIRAEIVEKNDALSKVEASEGALLQSAEETRRNLRAIEKNRVADALRATLTQRLAETSTKIDVLTKQKVELESKLAELRIRFKESIRDIRYVSPPTPQP
jgi:hypothetical protein